jgi:hypothetical protein
MLGETVEAISISRSRVEWIKEALRSSHADEVDFHKSAMESLNKEMTKLDNKMAKIYEDKIDGEITET